MIHQYKLHGTNIVVDGGSASIHIVDDLAYDAIKMLDEKKIISEIETYIKTNYPDVPIREVQELFEEIEALRLDDKLFSKRIVIENIEKAGEIKALCLHAAHVCNLKCDYCFAGQGRYHGESALMSIETAKRAIDFLIENSGLRYNLEVDFFGGEPLLNFEVVKQTVAYAREKEKVSAKNFRFTLTTNGMLLDDDIFDFCEKEISNVVLSLDGRQETHDSRRKKINGVGSYGEILPKIKHFTGKRGKNYYIRGTYTAANKDFLQDILHLADQGFRELAMEPAVLPTEHPLALKKDDLSTLFAQYEELAAEMRKRAEKDNAFHFYHYLLDLENGPCLEKRVKGCGAGSEYFAVTPDGTLYPCHQLVGEKVFEAGNIFTGLTKNYAFERDDVNTRNECKDCWGKLWCSGGCAANAYHDTGDINSVYEFGCELFLKRLECAIWLATAE